jgi:glucokinase
MNGLNAMCRPLLPRFAGHALVVDSGGTHSRFNVLEDTRDELVLSTVRVKTPDNGDAFVHSIQQQQQTMAAQLTNAPIDYIALAVAGPVQTQDGSVIGTNTGAYTVANQTLAQAVREATGLPTILVNDADAFVLGETLSPNGALYGKRNALGITLGTGIGGGIVLDGKLLTVGGRSVAEVGHIVIDQDGREVDPPRTRGCWEAYASGRGLLRTAQELLTQKGESSESVQDFLRRVNKTRIEQVTTYDIIQGAQHQNPLMKEVMTQWQDHIAAGLASVVNVVGITDVVVGGSMAQFVDYRDLTDRVKQRLIFPQAVKDTLNIVPSTLGDDAALIGAAHFAQQTLQLDKPANQDGYF